MLLHWRRRQASIVACFLVCPPCLYIATFGPVFVVPPIAIWLSLGKLLVNLLQVVKRTNIPLIPQHDVVEGVAEACRKKVGFDYIIEK